MHLLQRFEWTAILMLTLRAATEENQPATHNLDKQNPRSGVEAAVLSRKRRPVARGDTRRYTFNCRWNAAPILLVL
jgi:hypothetical protein